MATLRETASSYANQIADIKIAVSQKKRRRKGGKS